MAGRVRIERMFPGANGPSANVPSMSNETILSTSSLQRKKTHTEWAYELRKLIAERYANGTSRVIFDQGYYDIIMSDDELLSGIKNKFHTMTLQDVEIFVEGYKLNMLFG